MFWILGKALERFPGGFEQSVIKRFWMSFTILVQTSGDGKDNMEVRDGQEFLLSCEYPFFPLSILTLWTMTITTRVVTDADRSARSTGIKMSTERLSSAISQSSEHPLLMSRKIRTAKHRFPMLSQDLSDFMLWPHA